jgi:hypothetical protein
MSVNNLAKSIILQAIDDLSDRDKEAESAHFFVGEGFQICADIAALTLSEKVRVLDLVFAPKNARRRKGTEEISLQGLEHSGN